MTSRHRLPPAPAPRAAPLRLCVVRRTRAWGAALLGTLSGLACGMALFARVPVVDGVAPLPARTLPPRALVATPVATVIEPAVGAGALPAHDPEEGLP